LQGFFFERHWLRHGALSWALAIGGFALQM
jgi:hypothetical protein